MVSLNELQRLFQGAIRISEPLAHHTTFGVGGPADYYLEPASRADLVSAVRYLRRQGCPYLLIVSVNHLLASEEGYRGAVINIERCLSSIRLTGDGVHAEAAVRLGAFSEFCIERGLSGGEIAAGLQGTVGGGILKNVKARGKALNEFLVGVDLLREGNPVSLGARDVAREIRRTGPDRDIILSAAFRFPSGRQEEVLRLRRELLMERNALRPINVPGGGAIFRDTPQASAAQLLSRAGIRRKKHGGAASGGQHVNCIVNEGGAASTDILALIRTMQRTVREKLHVNLEVDLRMIGFDERILREVA